MVDINPKALEHACLCAGRSVHHFDRMGDDLPLRSSIVAHARAIERLEATEARHAAELRAAEERADERYQQAIADVVEWLTKERLSDTADHYAQLITRRFGKDA